MDNVKIVVEELKPNIEVRVTSGGIKGDSGEQGIQGIQGIQGVPGSDGANGQGVPTGGTADQVLTKIDGTDYNTEWRDASGGGGSYIFKERWFVDPSAINTYHISGGELTGRLPDEWSYNTGVASTGSMVNYTLAWISSPLLYTKESLTIDSVYISAGDKRDTVNGLSLFYYTLSNTTSVDSIGLIYEEYNPSGFFGVSGVNKDFTFIDGTYATKIIPQNAYIGFAVATNTGTQTVRSGSITIKFS